MWVYVCVAFFLCCKLSLGMKQILALCACAVGKDSKTFILPEITINEHTCLCALTLVWV